MSELTEPFKFYLGCCTNTLLDEIANSATQKQLAIIYALAMCSYANGADKPDWPKINRAIVDRWSMSGLVRVKDMAWRIVRQRALADPGEGSGR